MEKKVCVSVMNREMICKKINLCIEFNNFHREDKSMIPFSFQFNGEIMSGGELIDRLKNYRADDYDVWTDRSDESGVEGEYCRMCVEAFKIYDVEIVERDYNGPSYLEAQYSVPGVEEMDCKRFSSREVIREAVKMGLIADYTDEFEGLEVVVDLENDGYFSAYHGKWIDVPNCRKRIDYNGWLANLEYDMREKLAERLVERICIR